MLYTDLEEESAHTEYEVSKMQMGLNHDQFLLVQDGSKTIEIRLNDAKRRQLRASDAIEFVDTTTAATLIKHVQQLEVFSTFAELYSRYGGAIVGSAETDSVAKMVADTYTIYTPEQEKTDGVLAIHLQ